MSHDGVRTSAFDGVITRSKQVPVDPAEYAKFCYLIKAMDALDRADIRADEDIEFFRRNDGVKAERRFDWNVVIRHCSPQLLISFLQGAERFEMDRKFREHPHSIIVVRTAQIVYLDEVFELALEGSDRDPSVTSVGETLRSLRSQIGQLEGIAAVDALALVNRLERVLKIK
jgi:hypothetical protein